jgi:prophage regulatory protein
MILRLKDVITRTGLSRPTIYRLIARGEFPRQVELGPNSVGWRADKVQEWIETRVERGA